MTDGRNKSMSSKNGSAPDSVSFELEGNNVTIIKYDNKNSSVKGWNGTG